MGKSILLSIFLLLSQTKTFLSFKESCYYHKEISPPKVTSCKCYSKSITLA